MKHNGYDFAGWVTKYNVLCSDGRTIKNNSFAHQDGKKVPLVYNHVHDNIREVLGYTILENRPNEGVFGYSYCNGTDSGSNAKEAVAHGDLDSYSIYATRLQEMGGNVFKGNIKEVSIVLAGANPEAIIQNVALQHADGTETSIDEAVICFNEPFEELSHSDSEDEEYDEEYDEDYDEELEPVEDEYPEDEEYEDSEDGEYDESEEYDDEEYNDEDGEYDDEEYDDSEEAEYDDEYEESEDYEFAHSDLEHRDVGDVLETLNDEQKRAFIYVLDKLIYNKENDEMKHNAFYDNDSHVLTHADADDIIERAKSQKVSSFKDFFTQAAAEAGFTHADDGIDYATDAQDYGVNDPSFLFPDAKTLDIPPRFIQRDMGWVSTFMSGTKHSPFSRIKSMFADITEDEARARGYIKGTQKYPELIKLLKRVTTPQTIYKMQKFDRDDMIDITDFNLKSWILPEMRMMLNEEIARAALIGDGREDTDPYKIKEDNVRPIYKDASLFTIHAQVTKGTGSTDDEVNAGTARNIRRAILKAKKLYKGSGNLTFFTTEDWKTEMLLIDDGIGHPLYKTEAELATALGVSRIVTVPVMEGMSSNGKDLIGIAVNLNDYTFGSVAGGSIENFEDFDIDFNQYKFLMETRLCGCLTVPYSAIVLEVNGSSNPSQD